MKVARALVMTLMTGVVAVPSAPRGASAQRPSRQLGVITGIVTDTALRPIPSAEVLLVGTDISLTVDRSGRFEFREVPARRYLLQVRKVGFKPFESFVSVKGGDTLRLSYMLEPGANTLRTVTVTGRSATWRLAQFDDDRKRETGDFFSAEDITRRHAREVSDMLELSKTVRIVGNGLGSSAVSVRGNCVMPVLLNGLHVADAAINTLARPKDLVGIEVYAGPSTIPLKYRVSSTSDCGLIALWTK